METALPPSPSSISNIYYLANTPMYLYTMMRQDNYVVLLAERDSTELMNEFDKLAASEMTKQDEVAFLYAVLISLTFKPYIEVGDFMKHVQADVKYEWFPNIAEIYLKSTSSSLIISSFTVPPAVSSLVL